MTLTLLVMAVMAVALIAYTFYSPAEVAHGAEKTRAAFLKERKEQVYENLRDLNFEHKAGKLPEDDYVQMRTSLEDEAAALLAEIERLELAQKNAIHKEASGNLKKSNLKGARS